MNEYNHKEYMTNSTELIEINLIPEESFNLFKQTNGNGLFIIRINLINDTSIDCFYKFNEYIDDDKISIKPYDVPEENLYTIDKSLIKGLEIEYQVNDYVDYSLDDLYKGLNSHSYKSFKKNHKSYINFKKRK